MDQNNMYQQENIGVQSEGQGENPYVQPAGQAQNPYVQPMGQAGNPYTVPMQPQTAYQPPVISEDVSMGEWMWTMLVLGIPVVNLILMLVWAFGGGTKPSKANYCKAMLLWMVISVCLCIVLFIIGIFLGIGAVNYMLHSNAFITLL